MSKHRTCPECGGSKSAKARICRGCFTGSGVHRGSVTECVVDGCAKKPVGRGYCNAHYQRLKSGKPLSDPIGFYARRPLGRLCECGCGEELVGNHASRRKYNDGHKGRGKARRAKAVVDKCCFAGCGNKRAISSPEGLCQGHYVDRLKGRDLVVPRWNGEKAAPAPVKECEGPDCCRPATAKGMCDAHYGQMRRMGSMSVLRSDLPKLSVYSSGNGYMSVIDELGRKVSAHRHVMEQVLGRPLREHENVHHINGVKHDNRPENLELWVKPQPAGQRVEDLVHWVLSEYGGEVERQLSKPTLFAVPREG